jgi:hypothetical protein
VKPNNFSSPTRLRRPCSTCTPRESCIWTSRQKT